LRISNKIYTSLGNLPGKKKEKKNLK